MSLSVGLLVFPAATAVPPLEQERLVTLLGHLARRVPHALERAAVESERHRVPRSGNGEHEGAETRGDLRLVDLELDRRLEAVALGRDLVEGLLTQLLTYELAARLHPDDDASAFAIGEGAERLHGLTQLARRAFELEGRGFAFGDELGEGWDHGEPAASRRRSFRPTRCGRSS